MKEAIDEEIREIDNRLDDLISEKGALYYEGTPLVEDGFKSSRAQR